VTAPLDPGLFALRREQVLAARAQRKLAEWTLSRVRAPALPSAPTPPSASSKAEARRKGEDERHRAEKVAKKVREARAELARAKLDEEEEEAMSKGEKERRCKCGADNPPTVKFCQECAAPMPIVPNGDPQDDGDEADEKSARTFTDRQSGVTLTVQRPRAHSPVTVIDMGAFEVTARALTYAATKGPRR
jgi:hypothetical protein